MCNSGTAVRREVLTALEVCGMLGIARTTLYRLLKSGQLRARKAGRRYYCTRAALDEFLNPQS